MELAGVIAGTWAAMETLDLKPCPCFQRMPSSDHAETPHQGEDGW